MATGSRFPTPASSRSRRFLGLRDDLPPSAKGGGSSGRTRAHAKARGTAASITSAESKRSARRWSRSSAANILGEGLPFEIQGNQNGALRRDQFIEEEAGFWPPSGFCSGVAAGWAKERTSRTSCQRLSLVKRFLKEGMGFLSSLIW